MQDDFEQAVLRYSLMDPQRRIRFQERLILTFEDDTIPLVIKLKWVHIWNLTNFEIGTALATGIARTDSSNPGALTTSPFLPPTTASLTGAPSSSEESGFKTVPLSHGAVAAIVIGSIVFAAIFAIVIFLIIRNMKQYQ